MDQDWTVTRITRENKDKAWKQLGTSGSGNHFVEFGLLTLTERRRRAGPRGGRVRRPAEPQRQPRHRARPSARRTAPSPSASLPKKYEDARPAGLARSRQRGGPGILGRDEPDGRLRRRQPRRDPPAGVEAARAPRSSPASRTTTTSPGRKRTAASEVIVHRKGATPAGEGVLGVIPGSMADPAFVVRGKGNAESLQLGLARRRPPHVAHRRPSEKYTWQGRAEGPGEARASACCRPAPTKCPASTRTSTT